MHIRSWGLVLAIAAVAGLSTAASAETLQFKADLKASNEVPPNNSAGSGALTATFDTATKQLSWKGNYTGLSGPLIASHFHGPATTGQNAPVAVPINASSPNFEGSATLTDAQANDLVGGRWYVNLHTEAN